MRADRGRRWLAGAIAGLAADRAGNVAIMFGAVTLLLAVCSAFAIDEGALYVQRRTAQAAVDLAAIAAAAAPADAESIARATLVRNGLLATASAGDGAALPRLIVETGRYTADPSTPVEARFVVGGSPVNAVRLGYYEPGQLYFARLWADPPVVGVSAVASTAPEVSFSIGSGLVSLEGGLVNAVLGQLLGTSIDLSAVNYQHLLAADVSVFDFLDALAGELGIEAGTYSDVLSARASRGELVSALAAALSGSDQLAALALAASLGPGGAVPLDRLFDLGGLGRLAIGTGAESGYAASVSVLRLIAAAIALSDGTHEASLSLATGIPGVTGFSVRVAIGEPAQRGAWFAIGGVDTRVSTAQVRLALLLTLAGGPALPGVSVRLPLYLSVADSEAEVGSVECPAADATNGAAVIDTIPGIASLELGEPSGGFADFDGSPELSPARLIDTPLLKVIASGEARMGDTEPVALRFSPEDIAHQTARTATADNFTRSLAQSMVDSMQLRVTALGLGLPTQSTLRAVIGTLLTPVTPAIDAAIGSVAESLGLGIGEADVVVYRAECRRAALVQ